MTNKTKLLANGSTRTEIRTALANYELTLSTYGHRRKTYEIRRGAQCLFSGPRLEAIAWIRQIQSWEIKQDELNAWFDRAGSRSGKPLIKILK